MSSLLAFGDLLRAERCAFGALIVGSGVGGAAPSQAEGSGGASAPRAPRQTAEVAF